MLQSERPSEERVAADDDALTAEVMSLETLAQADEVGRQLSAAHIPFRLASTEVVATRFASGQLSLAVLVKARDYEQALEALGLSADTSDPEDSDFATPEAMACPICNSTDLRFGAPWSSQRKFVTVLCFLIPPLLLPYGLWLFARIVTTQPETWTCLGCQHYWQIAPLPKPP